MTKCQALKPAVNSCSYARNSIRRRGKTDKNDKVSTTAKWPKVPVGGRLRQFIFTKMGTNNQRSVGSQYHKGGQLEFIQNPPFFWSKGTKSPEKIRRF